MIPVILENAPECSPLRRRATYGRPKPTWSGAEIATLRRMHAEGARDTAIAAVLPGRSVGAIGMMRYQLGLPSVVRPPNPHQLVVGEVIHIGGVPYVYVGKGKIDGDECPSRARVKRDSAGKQP